MPSEWFNRNYKNLEKWSKYWHEDWSGLLSSYYEWLVKNWDKFDKMDEESKSKWSMNWFKMNGRVWNNSDFNRQSKLLAQREDFEIQEGEFLEEHYFEWGDLSLWIKDITENYSEKECRELVRCRQLYLTLPLHKKVLWDLYFNQMLSMRDISSKLNLPLTSVYKMIKDLKEEIKNG
jgi:hypothetical protein